MFGFLRCGWGRCGYSERYDHYKIGGDNLNNLHHMLVMEIVGSPEMSTDYMVV